MGKEYKVCLLGSGSVGKSALAIQFTENRFVESYDPTVEDCYRKRLDDGAYAGSTLEIIDTAGTEQFTSMVELYIKNCVGFILVYDVTKKSSFEGLDAIYEMVKRVKKPKGKNAVPMVVVGNKVDMEDKDREVLMGQGHAKAKAWGAIFLEASAKTRLKVDNIFRDLVTAIEKGNKKGGCVLC